MLNTLHNTYTETISAFRFRLYWLFGCQDAGGHAFSRQNIWVAIPVDWVILHWYACGADGRLVGRTITWLPKFLGWVDYHIFLARVELRYHHRHHHPHHYYFIIIIIVIIIHLRCEVFSFSSLILYFLQTILIMSLTNGTKTMKENRKKEKAILRMKRKIKMLS